MATITGTSGDDTIVPGPSGPGVSGGPVTTGPDSISGLGGDDIIDGAAGNDTLIGGDGDDSLWGGLGADLYSGGSGYDLIIFSPRKVGDAAPTRGAVASLKTGVIANDGFNNAESMVGGAANDLEMLIGTAEADDLTGKNAGVDSSGFTIRVYLRGSQGNDTLRAAASDTASVTTDHLRDIAAINVNFATGVTIDGWGNTDTLVRVAGVRGSAFSDTMTGSDADNWFRGEGGDDTIDGGGGIDIASFASSTGSVVADLVTGNAADGLGGTDRLLNIENLSGSGTAADTLLGSAADNLLLGNGGNDMLDGRGGADRVFGGDGKDTLVGGSGNDTLLGSAGADLLDAGRGDDVFRYTFASHGGDTILGFRTADDAFQIDASGFGGGLFAGIDIAATGRFVANKSGNATSAAGVGQFVFETDTKILRWDADGGGGAAGVVIATIDGQNPTSADFIVVA